jgi:hypothetical protein
MLFIVPKKPKILHVVDDSGGVCGRMSLCPHSRKAGWWQRHHFGKDLEGALMLKKEEHWVLIGDANQASDWIGMLN